jgi:hypothetical protein
MNSRHSHRPYSIWKAGILAGLAGGAIEIGVVGVYAAFTEASAGAVARGVTETLFSQGGAWALAAPLGIAIHMVIAVALGVALAAVLQPLFRRSSALGSAAVVAVLIGIWSMNFLVVLPQINPAFVTLVPYVVSFASKTLFGVATASVLFAGRAVRPKPTRALVESVRHGAT